MGIFTLDHFRAELQTALNRQEDTDVLDRWIQVGYRALASAIDFEELDSAFLITTVGATKNYTFTPISNANFLGIKYVYDETAGDVLEAVPKQDFFTYEDFQAIPERYTLDRTDIYFHPVPSGTRVIRTVYKIEPTALTTIGQQTVLPAAWDRAIVGLAAAHAFSLLDEWEKAALWEQEITNYITTRISPERIEEFHFQNLYPARDLRVGQQDAVRT